jgi:hypothetical protein
MAAKKLLKVGIIPLQELDIVPVLAGTEAGEGFTRAVPPPEEVCSQSANETQLVISMAQGSAVL